MKPRHIVLAVVILMVLAAIILPNLSNLTFTAPMLGMPVTITRNGAVVPRDEIASVNYLFSEEGTSTNPISTPAQTKKARQLTEDIFLVTAPFTIARKGLSKPSVSPRYRSLYLRVAFVDGSSFSLTIPVISSTELSRPIQIDVSHHQSSASFPPIELRQLGAIPAHRLIGYFLRENIPVDVECASHSFNNLVTISPQDTDAIVLLDKFSAATGFQYRIEGTRVTIFDPTLGGANPLDRPVGPIEWKDATRSEALKQLGDACGVPIMLVAMSLKAWQTEPTVSAHFPGGSTREALNFLATSLGMTSWYSTILTPPDKTKPALLSVSFSSGVPEIPVRFETKEFQNAPKWEGVSFRLDDTAQLPKPSAASHLQIPTQ